MKISIASYINRRRFRSAMAVATVVLGSVSGGATGHAQTVYTYYTGNSNAYLNASHWLVGTGSTVSTKFPGLSASSSVTTANGTSTDIADFGVLNASVNTIGINLYTSTNTGVTTNAAANGSLIVGAFDFTSSLTTALSIGNSSTTAAGTGTVTFTGQTLNNIPNTIVSNESAQNVSLVPNIATSGTSRPAMAIGLNNTTTNVIQTTNTGSITISSVIQNGTGTGASNSLTINSSGTGAVILSGANTYSGTTTVTAGTLLVNGTNSGAGAVAVNAGTLGGTGSISGTVTVASGATLQGGAGTSTGTLTLVTAPTLNPGSILQMTLDASLNHSTLALPAGSNPFNSNQAFNFTGSPVDGTYDNIITGVASGINTSGWTINNGFNAYSFVDDGTNIDLIITDVPEPATVLGGLALVGVAVCNQRRRLRGLVGSWRTGCVA